MFRGLSYSFVGLIQEIISQIFFQIGRINTVLFHSVTVADSNGFRLVFNRLKINRNAQRRSDFIMTTIRLADISRIFQRNAANAQFQQILLNLVAFRHNLLIVLLERNNRNFNRSQMLFELQNNPAVALAQILFLISLVMTANTPLSTPIDGSMTNGTTHLLDASSIMQSF